MSEKKITDKVIMDARKELDRMVYKNKTEEHTKITMEMVEHFVKRWYKELYNEEHETDIEILKSAWGSIDFLYIGDCTISVNDIRTAQHYDIPCSVVDKRYWERQEKDLKMNLRSYWHLH